MANADPHARERLRDARRLVVKLGSAVVAPSTGIGPTPDIDRIGAIAAEIAGLVAGGREVVLVSSGAVACGLGAMGLREMPHQIVDKQAAAAIGQPALIARWSASLGEHAITAGQVLLTADDFEDRTRFLNAHRTMATLLGRGAVPVINENDSVAFDELKLGDNDRLSALVASAIDADALLLLSTARGLEDPGGRVVPEVVDLESARALVRDTKTDVGTGGMTTKLEAARIATEAGADVVIAPGAEPGVIGRLFRGERIGTFFPAGASQAAARKRWIGAAARVQGRLHVDAGAARALLEKGASLLPIGLTRVEGEFAVGGGVEIIAPDGAVIARGLSNYSSADSARLIGKKTDEIEPTLGYIYAAALVHRDDLYLGGQPTSLPANRPPPRGTQP